MPDLIKIGKTARDSRSRAKELSSTSVPTPFKVAFEIFSADYDNLEKQMHKELEDFRINQNREFFRYPLDKAIKLLQDLNALNKSKAEEYQGADITETEEYQAVDITEDLSKKYPNHLKEGIVAVRIVQLGFRVWLEITTEEIKDDGTLVTQTIKREDLAFIVNGNVSAAYFNPEDSVQINAKKYVEEFDPYSIIKTSDLFKEECCIAIENEYLGKEEK